MHHAESCQYKAGSCTCPRERVLQHQLDNAEADLEGIEEILSAHGFSTDDEHSVGDLVERMAEEWAELKNRPTRKEHAEALALLQEALAYPVGALASKIDALRAALAQLEEK